MSRWIWDSFHRETPNQVLLFRRRVEGTGPLVGGELSIAARGSFRVWLDGEFLTHQDLQSPRPGGESTSVDLTPALAGRRLAELVVGVHLLGVGTHHQPRTLGGLWVEGSLREADGTLHRVDSDRNWATQVPTGWRQNTRQMVWSAGFTECSDRTLPPDHAWSGAVEYTDDDRPVPYDRPVVETRVDLEEFRHGHTFHLPHQLVGFLTLDVELPPEAGPTTIDVLAGETVDERGRPTAERQGISAVDTVVVPGGRTTHRFWNRRTFRDLAVVAHTTSAVRLAATFDSLTAKRPTPQFRTGDERWNRMHAVSLATARVGRQDFYEDCPLREGGHYVADARVQALFDLASTGVATTSRRSIRQFAAEQDPDGMLPALSPSGTRHRIPDFSLQWPSFLDDHVRFTADEELLYEVFPALVATMAWADAHWNAASGHFRLDEPGWWPFVDWYEFTPDALQAAVDAQYAVALDAAATLAERHADSSLADTYRSRRDDVLAMVGPTVRHPHAAVILLTGLTADLAKRFVAPDVLDGFSVETGYFAFWLCRAHLVLGDRDAARALVEDYWGSMLDAGAGTWWERWSPRREVVESTAASLCHPWSAGPLVLLPALALGVDPFARNVSDATFSPVELTGPLSATLHTPWGLSVASPTTPLRSPPPR